jgi:hypothetical protein
MYKSLLFWHLPLLTRAITLETNMEENDVNGSFSFIRRTTKEYNSEDYDRIINLPLPQERILFKQFIFNKSSANKCYFTGCENRFIRVFVANKTMFILFNTGNRMYDIRSLDKGFTVEQKETGPYESNPHIVKQNVFYEFLQFIREICTEHDITQIVLSGHSNGSNAATITAFILMAMFHPAYRERNADIIGDWYADIERWQGEFAMLNKSVFLVCTGTLPLLFSTQAKFKDFYNQLRGRYVSVLSGFYVPMPDGKKPIYIDYFGSPFYDLHLYKYGIYYGNIKESDPYKGIVAFYKIVINPDYSTYDDWTINVNDKHRQLFSSQNSAKDKVPEGLPVDQIEQYRKMLSDGINDPRGISFKTPYTKPAVVFTNVNTDLFLQGFDRIGNQFVNCDYPEQYYPYNRPGIKNCKSYKETPHQLSFYRYLLSIFIYGVRNKNEAVFEEGGQSLGVKRAKHSRKKRSKKRAKKHSKKRQA